jgi:urease accessory protein
MDSAKGRDILAKVLNNGYFNASISCFWHFKGFTKNFWINWMNERQGSRIAWQGVLNLRYDRPAAQTRLQSAYAQAPLKIQRSFYPESDTCHTVLLHTAGGMVGGDRLTYQLHLEPETRVLVTTAAASKVYRSNGLAALQKIDIHVAAQACLEWLPQETILFEGAQFQQSLKVNLEPSASWLGWDIYRFGRTARDECFMTGDWRSHTEVWQGTRPLWIDRQFYPASPERWNQSHALNGCPVVGTLVWVGTSIAPDFIHELRQLPFQGLSQAALGISRLEQGLICRYRGSSTRQSREWFTQIWNHVRCSFLGYPACPPRVWQL